MCVCVFVCSLFPAETELAEECVCVSAGMNRIEPGLKAAGLMKAALTALWALCVCVCMCVYVDACFCMGVRS